MSLRSHHTTRMAGIGLKPHSRHQNPCPNRWTISQCTRYVGCQRILVKKISCLRVYPIYGRQMRHKLPLIQELQKFEQSASNEPFADASSKERAQIRGDPLTIGKNAGEGRMGSVSFSSMLASITLPVPV